MNLLAGRTTATLLAVLAGWTTLAVWAKEPASIEIEPDTLTLNIGETAQLKAVVKDADGNVLPDAQVIFFGSRSAMSLTPSGFVKALKSGEHRVTALAPKTSFSEEPDYYTYIFEPGVRENMEIEVPEPPITSISITDLPGTLYAGTTVEVRVVGTDETGEERTDIVPELNINEESIAGTDGFGTINGKSPGTATLVAKADDVEATLSFTVLENPVHSIELSSSLKEAKTGDVIHFSALPRDEQGRVVNHVPVEFTVQPRPDPTHADSVGAGASAMVLDDGRFVAEQPGIYTVIAMSGSATARAGVRITKRDVAREVEFLGQARIAEHRTSDLWIWEGVDGRDYAVVGGWNAGGRTYFYDVTDPTSMQLVDMVIVDARTVNDVKISENGKIAVISREGASNRKNGIVILDVSDPRNVEILSEFSDQLTIGVHNVFIHDSHVYAVNLGRWDVINIEDPRNPYRVGRFESETQGASVHDVWVRDGILYQAGATEGVLMVDVGGGGKEGTPSHPVEMGRIKQYTGANHAVWPFRSESAGKFYVVAGDEMGAANPRIPREEMFTTNLPFRWAGWLHFIEFDDLDNPVEIARYEVGDFGTHNYWVDWEEELLYVAYYQGGLRVVDVSGELVGDLYAQGREVARFYSDDPKGYIPNAPQAWGPQPHKGTIFFSDHHSGLWAVKLADPEEEDGVEDDSEEDAP